MRLDPQRGCNWRTIGDKSVCRIARQARLKVVRLRMGPCLCNHRVQDEWRAWNCPLMPGRAALMTRLLGSRSRRHMAVTRSSVLDVSMRIRPTWNWERRGRKHRD